MERKGAAPPSPTVKPKPGGCEGLKADQLKTTAGAVEPVAAPLKSKNAPTTPSLLALAVRRRHLQEQFLGIFHFSLGLLLGSYWYACRRRMQFRLQIAKMRAEEALEASSTTALGCLAAGCIFSFSIFVHLKSARCMCRFRYGRCHHASF